MERPSLHLGARLRPEHCSSTASPLLTFDPEAHFVHRRRKSFCQGCRHSALPLVSYWPRLLWGLYGAPTPCFLLEKSRTCTINFLFCRQWFCLHRQGCGEEKHGVTLYKVRALRLRSFASHLLPPDPGACSGYRPIPLSPRGAWPGPFAQTRINHREPYLPCRVFLRWALLSGAVRQR